MARFNPRTKHGHSLFTMSSMLQKSIRRGDIPHAAYAANELFGDYNNYLWKRLLVISAEDCYGIITKEIVGLKLAENITSGDKKGYDRDGIFMSKAVVLLCLARKNRDACYVACNFMIGKDELDVEDIPWSIDFTREEQKIDSIPDWVFDVHTWEGRRRGKTDLDMTIDEEKALYPHQLSLFDNASWGMYYDEEIKQGNIDFVQQMLVDIFQRGKENDPTHNGEKWPKHKEVWGTLNEQGRVVIDPDYDIPDEDV